jgi:ppGpp synthetase/RelA/SpoT-type nucleotidyltranferase
VGLIEDFIARYTKEYDFYDRAGRIAAQSLEADLQAAGVRSIVTSRAKSISRLEEKCRKRVRDRGDYSSVDAIFEDIVDLAGVRVALYFPAERDQVDGAIARLFHLISPKKIFPEKAFPEKRFSGYSAVHYRVQIKEESLAESDQRYAAARIEVQVASVLMHAWAEVEHDLAYKPLEGQLSEGEYALLDQLNGLVLAGEIALEQLQKAGEARVASRARKMENHYDLAVYLLSQAGKITDQPVSDSGLGRVDLLFDLVTALGKDTPERLEPYLESLHENFEMRPLAEQVIDALLAEDPSRYELYNTIRAQRRSPLYGPDSDIVETYNQFGVFLSRWNELERLLRGLQRGRAILPTRSQLERLHLLDDDMTAEFDLLRRLRNNLVHGVETPSAAELAEAARRLDIIIAEIKRRIQSNGGPEESPPDDTAE